MKIKPILLVLGIILIISLLALVIYFATFTKITFVHDESWSLLMPKGSTWELRKKLIGDGIRLKVERIKQTNLEEPDYLVEDLKKLDSGELILTSPVVTAAINVSNINIKDLMNTKIIGMGSKGEFFDEILASDTFDAWIDAAKIATKKDDNVAVIYDSGSIVEAKLIFENVTSDNICKYNKDGYGEIFDTEISNNLKNDKISLVFCPPIDGINSIVKKGISQSWIVDYRYSLTIPEDNLFGVIYPDVYNSLKDGQLKYEYRTIK